VSIADTAVVLAAGLSTRIAPAVRDRPKPLIDVDGEPVLSRTLRWLVSEGIANVWINLHHHGGQVERLVGDGRAYGARVRYSREERLLGTAGAVRRLRTELTTPFWVVYGDNLLSLSLSRMQAFHAAGGFSLTIGVFDSVRQISTGIAGGRVRVGAGGRVTEFVEAPTEISPLVNAGIYFMRPEVVDLIPPDQPHDFARQLFPSMLARGLSLGAYVVDDYCLGLDTPEALARLTDLISSGKVRPR
jgi:NDP-sugar pyrophosphorylase family protein